MNRITLPLVMLLPASLLAQELPAEVESLYSAYVQEIQQVLDESGSPEKSDKPDGATHSGTPPGALQTGSLQPGALQTSPLQTSALQTGSLQPSGHIHDYTPLPDVRPTSSILYPTEAQLAHRAAIEAKVAAEKRRYQANPLPR